MHHKTLKRYDIPHIPHELTFSCFQQKPFLQDEWLCQTLADYLRKALDQHNIHLWAYVFMPEHVHMIIYPIEESCSIPSFLKSLKQPVSQKFIAMLQKNDPDRLSQYATGVKDEAFRLWMPGGGYDRNVTEMKTLKLAVEYIHRNPVRRKLVENPEEWKWSSAKEWEELGSGPVRIDREMFQMF